MYIIVIGCGKIGSAVADLLSKNGENVVVIDRDKSAFDKLSPDFTGFTINGDATELQVLLEAKLDKANMAIVTTEIDSVNSMVSQIAKDIYEVPEVIVKINQPDKAIIYRNTDIVTLSPTDLFIDSLRERLAGTSEDSIDEESLL
ncbi:MAG: TrkA family potassium uptake protein [Halanaerobiales bacterium]|nr:TrkA family potassium uptake protein [Halanaerobiales bacterium]